MKKLSLVLALILVLTCAVLAACGGDETSTPAASSKVESSKPAASSKVESSAAESSAADSSAVESSTVESSEEASQAPAEDPKAPIAITGKVISMGCSYEVPGGEGYIDTKSEWPATYNAKLTDGVAAAEIAYDSTWNAFCSSLDDDGAANLVDNVGSVIIDLGAAKKVSGVKANVFVGNESGIVAPASIVVYTSADGENFSNPVSLTLPAGPVGFAEGGFEAVDAQYVKVDFTKGADGVFMFVNEIEVYGA